MAAKAISINADVAEVQYALEGTGKSLKTIQRLVLRTIAKGALKEVKAVIRSKARWTGSLLKSYGYKVKKDASAVSVYPKNGTDENRTNFIKAAVLSWGRPQRRIEPKGFVQAGITYAEGNSYKKEIDRVVEKELKKYWG